MTDQRLALNDRPGSFVCLGVSDSGCGIAAEILPKILSHSGFICLNSQGKPPEDAATGFKGNARRQRNWLRQFEPG